MDVPVDLSRLTEEPGDDMEGMHHGDMEGMDHEGHGG